MATIPTYDNFRAMPTGSAQPYLSDGGAPATGAIAARQVQEMGAAAAGAGDVAVRIAREMQEQVDQVRVADAMNRARQTALGLAYDPQTGYLSLKGNAALERPEGQPLPEEYGGKLRAQIGAIAQGLGTERQRRLFAEQSGNLATTFSGQVQAHMLQEFKSHALSVQDGTLTLASDEAKRNWSKPDLIGPALQRADAAVVQKGALLGWSATETDAARLLASSKVHTDVVLEALANGNPAYAQTYLASRRAGMTADDILKVEGHVNQQVWSATAQQAVQTATTQVMPKIAPNAFDRMVAITAQTESGGQDFGPDGKILTSPKGAKGSMQVLDSTMANPGLPGVQPLDPKTATPAQRAKFGQQYLQALMQRYGHPAQAWAAYNAGFGAVDKALAEAKRDGESGAFRTGVPADWWLQKLPKETQAYVAKNMQALAAGGGISPRPTELEFVNQAVAALPPGTPPTVVQTTRERAQQQYGVITKSMNETADSALASAQRWIVANPGTTVDQLPMPIRASLQQFAPGKIDDLIDYARKVGNPEVTTDLAVYNRLAANPELLRRMGDGDFEMLKARLSPADFKHFANERAALLNPTGGSAPGNADTAAINAAVSEHLRALKVDPTPKDDGGADAARVGGIRKFVTDNVLAAQARAGKKFTEAEVRQEVGRLFADQGVSRSWFGADKAQAALLMKAGDIPGTVKDALKADFKRLGVSDPTDAQLLGAYWTAMQQTKQVRR